MSILEHLISIAIGSGLLCLIYVITSWELTVVTMFFWLCFILNILSHNQHIITTNQQTIMENQVKLEKLIKEMK